MLRVREYDKEKDLVEVEEMERLCEIGADDDDDDDDDDYADKKVKKNKANKSLSLFVDLMGDPMSRIRHTPEHVMMIGEYGEEKEIVGVIRACIKMVTRGRRPTRDQPIYAKVAYILGLRVSPTHRRRGVGTKLVESVESWCRAHGAEYAYMATDSSNTASLNLFVHKLSYVRFRSPMVLVHPVHAHALPLRHQSVSFLHVPPWLAATLYRRLFATNSEFFPSDIISVLSNPLTLATLVAVPANVAWEPTDALHGALPPSFAVLSLWNCGGVFRMRVGGAHALARVAMALARALDVRAPWMRVPSLRDVFRPFGVYLMYGLHMQGKEGGALMTSLCRLAHNIAREDERCAAVVAEVGPSDPVRAAVPHWRRLSWGEDVWCMKRFGSIGSDAINDNWVKSQATSEIIFVDPREF